MARSQPGCIKGRRVDLRARGSRLALRPLQEADLLALEPWYGEAAAALTGMSGEPGAAGSVRLLEAARRDDRRHLLAITEREGGEPIGLLGLRSEYFRERTLTIDFVAVEASHRGRGLGGEAVLVLEEAAVRRGIARRFLAGVRPSQGRALYFWLRLGYRPLLSSELDWAGAPPGMVWMAREAGGQSAGGKG